MKFNQGALFCGLLVGTIITLLISLTTHIANKPRYKKIYTYSVVCQNPEYKTGSFKRDYGLGYEGYVQVEGYDEDVAANITLPRASCIFTQKSVERVLIK